MNQDTNKDYFREYAQMGKALSNENRLEILSLLIQSKKTVEAIAEETGLSIANTSKHLQVLLKSHLVRNERYKNFFYYRLADEKIEQMLTNFLEVAQEQIQQQHLVKDKFLGEAAEEYTVSIEEMEEKIQREEIVLVDVRPSDEFETAHIPGAVSMPIEELNTLVEGLPQDKTIVAYCRGPHCVMASKAIDILEQSGRKAVKLAQGVNDWKLHKKESSG